MHAKGAKEKLDAGILLSNIREFREQLLILAENHRHEPLSLMIIQEMLQDWLAIDISDQEGQIRRLIHFNLDSRM